MTEDNQQPTICLKCRYRIRGTPLFPDTPHCTAGDRINYVTGEPDPILCAARNSIGECELYAPIPEGSDPADIDELNAAVDRGEA